VVNLTDLTPAQRRLVLALVDAAKAEQRKAPVVFETPTEATLPEDHIDGRPEAA
jgi:hypothetical protein